MDLLIKREIPKHAAKAAEKARIEAAKATAQDILSWLRREAEKQINPAKVRAWFVVKSLKFH